MHWFAFSFLYLLDSPIICGGEIDKCYASGTDHCSEDRSKCICKPTYEGPYCETCKKNIAGEKCDRCVDGFFPFPYCNECKIF